MRNYDGRFVLLVIAAKLSNDDMNIFFKSSLNTHVDPVVFKIAIQQSQSIDRIRNRDNFLVNSMIQTSCLNLHLMGFDRYKEIKDDNFLDVTQKVEWQLKERMK